MSPKSGWGVALAVALALAGAPRALAQEAERPARGQAAAVEVELKQLAEKVGRSVVAVNATGSRGRMGDMRRGEPSGSGVIVGANGLVLTTVGVVPEGATRISVTLPGGKRLSADEARRDAALGLVLLKVRPLPEGGVPAVALREADALRRGSVVMTFGNPYGTITKDGQAAMSVGTLSGIDGATLETDAAVNPGSFGGPLVDARGNVVGIVVPEYRNERWLGLARAVDDRVLSFIALEQDSAQSGLVADDDDSVENRGLLGFYMYEDAEGPAKIEKVAPGGAADKAKLKAGDVIVAVNGKKVASAPDAAKRLKKVKAGETLTLRIMREEWEKEVKLTAEARPEAAAPAKPWLGLFAANLSGREGIAVDEVVAGSPAEKAGLKKGDVIRTVNGKKVSSTDELAKALDGKKVGDELALAIERTIDGESWEKKLALKLGAKPASKEQASTPTPRPETPAPRPTPEVKKGSGYLGVYLKDQPEGLLVESVLPGSPAEKYGLKSGDRIVAVSGEKIDSIETFTKALQKFGAGDKVEIGVSRGEGWNKPVEVVLGAKPERTPTPSEAPTPPAAPKPPTPPTPPTPPAPPAAEAKPAYLGVKLEETGAGLRVIDVLAGSPAEKAGLKVGQVITAIDGSAISTTEAFGKLIRSKKAGEKIVVAMGDAKVEILLGAKN